MNRIFVVAGPPIKFTLDPNDPILIHVQIWLINDRRNTKNRAAFFTEVIQDFR